jgi:hypothetical protein
MPSAIGYPAIFRLRGVPSGKKNPLASLDLLSTKAGVAEPITGYCGAPIGLELGDWCG